MTGKKKARKDIGRATEQQQQFANEAIATQQPFVDRGEAASNQFAALLGLNDGGEAAFNAFKNSPFFDFGNDQFKIENDRLAQGFSNQGLNFSGANLEARERARQFTQQNAFAQFLNGLSGLSNQGFAGAGNQFNAITGKGNAAFNAQLAKAGTRQGFLGGLQQAGNAFTSFFPKQQGGG